jgi:hypothetical protein
MASDNYLNLDFMGFQSRGLAAARLRRLTRAGGIVVSILLFCFTTVFAKRLSFQSPPTDTCGHWHNTAGYCSELNCSPNFIATTPAIAEPTRDFEVTCNPVYLASIKSNNNVILSALETEDTCSRLKLWEKKDPQPGDATLANMQYDSLRAYIEHCAAEDNSFWAFTHLNGAVQLRNNDTTRFEEYRTWLISVLFLNKTNPSYFCSCIGSIAGTYQFGKYHPLGYLSVLNYLRHNHHECWNSASEQEFILDSTMDSQMGYDVTHLPPLDSMGLGFLLESAVPVQDAHLSDYIASFTTSPNPFKEETHLRFHLNRMTYITIGIYDLLGHQVWGDGKGHSLEAGDHEVIIDGTLLPKGSLYARMETGFGEVKTVKLVKE